MLKVRYSARFKKDFKLVQKRGYDIRLFEEIVLMLCNEKPLPPKNNDHALSGNY
jgi:mRNA interferase YafQ